MGKLVKDTKGEERWFLRLGRGSDMKRDTGIGKPKGVNGERSTVNGRGERKGALFLTKIGSLCLPPLRPVVEGPLIVIR